MLHSNIILSLLVPVHSSYWRYYLMMHLISYRLPSYLIYRWILKHKLYIFAWRPEFYIQGRISPKIKTTIICLLQTKNQVNNNDGVDWAQNKGHILTPYKPLDSLPVCTWNTTTIWQPVLEKTQRKFRKKGHRAPLMTRWKSSDF